MKIIKRVAAALLVTTTLANACADIFINKGGFHVEARSMEFGINIAMDTFVRYVGQKQTSNIVINLDKIPQDKILTWDYKYGFVGRSDAFRPGIMLDGINSKGVSVSLLYAPGITTFPKYDATDKRDVINVYEVLTYTLSQASSTSDAIRKIKKLQIVGGAIEVYQDQYFKNVPIHLSIRDKRGNSAVVEWIDGKTVIYEDAGNVMTNSPSYDVQLKHTKKYSSLKTTNTKVNKKFENRVIDYKTIYNMVGTRPEQAALLGLPADFTPASRFVRATVLLDNMLVPKNSIHARQQATEIIDTVATIAISYDDLALWYVVKDLDNLVYYVRDAYFYQGKDSLYAYDPALGYQKYDLNNIDFTKIPLSYKKEFKALSSEEAKKIKVLELP